MDLLPSTETSPGTGRDARLAVVPVNTLVDILPNRPDSAAAGTAVPGRVEDDDPDAVVVSVAARALGLLAPRTGDELMLRWTAGSSACAQVVTYLGPRGDGLTGCVVRPVAAPVRTQRRHAFRIDLDLVVHLAVSDQWVPARLLDLSAAGARLHLPHDIPPARGTRLELAFDLEGEVFGLAATVVRRRDHGREGATVRVRFEEVRSREDAAVQRFLIAEQLRRRNGDA